MPLFRDTSPRLAAAIAILAVAPMLWASGAEGCLSCHSGKGDGFNPAHSFAPDDCGICHGGDTVARDKDIAHGGMTPFPGSMDNAAQACGSCHADKVASVSHSLMHTGKGMVEVTRRVVDGQAGDPGTNNIQSLGHGPADSMLRKLCVSCHLGQPKTEHRLDPTRDRGGGCLACHINHYPEEAHPALTRQVSDARCFGCHSRSGRISLNYTGLAETDVPTMNPLRLADGRVVERLPADVHYRAGMACVDCHSGAELMGWPDSGGHPIDADSADCVDCHEPAPEHAEFSANHERLECATCHSQWAPLCFGCHMEYDAAGRQWDHLEREQTPGRWLEERWDISNGPAAMGVNARGRIQLFIPGMIMSLAHPDWEADKFVRLFAPLSPHTTGNARSCDSCHRSSSALGLGAGEIEVRGENLLFKPRNEALADGLPADAWVGPDGRRGGATPRQGQRPLSPEEMRRILLAPLPEPSGQQPSSAAGGGRASSTSLSTNTGGTKGSAGALAEAAPAQSPTK